MTNVPIERMKLSCPKAWKGQLLDTMSLSDCKLKDGMLIMLIGSADTVAAQTTQIVFVEDLPEEEKAAVSLPVGFQNLGNTCYMNSTLQCLRGVPELKEALRSFTPGQDGAASMGGADMLTQALATDMYQVDRQTTAYSPGGFLNILRQVAPQFAETGAGGAPKQQDAEELLSTTLSTISQSLKTPHGIPDLGGASNLIDALFGMEMETTDTCDECPEEPPVTETRTDRKLTCFIQGGGGSTAHVDHLHEGVKLGLTENIEKVSSVLGREAVWTRTSKIKRLPRYVCVQFMRFYVKRDNVIEEGRQVVKHVKCKIMRPVTFPEVLDVYDFCGGRIQKMLKTNRDRHGDEILGDLKVTAAAASGDGLGASEPMDVEGAAGGGAAEGAATADPADVKVDAMDEEGEDDAALQAALAMSMGGEAPAGGAAAEPEEVAGPGLTADFQGNYELFGITTHKGRLADGGHYMGWVRQDGDDWLLFDDSDVSPCKTEDIMALKGGGDHHMAYLAFYRFKN
eukprot:CAMPEP_0182582666 /NCGR_PEP_ID=MMETSP1324-20130603/53214_1 /TAXON_ID=236786 /ORGANISM="Florenciella sp., Strain RCC1587" /LENGTH=511 /DNA_ID=CAMNT_0024799159 /DNA_START=51 /DNA_END=1586 /DNA_ORIENTATION=-